MKNNSTQIKTNKLMYGKWFREDNSQSSELNLVIEKDRFGDDFIKIFEKASEKTFFEGPFNAHWMENYLIHQDERHFFIEYATEEHLLFGEGTIGLSPDIKWRIKFNRAK